MKAIKYPKTSYLPWSNSIDGKDNVISNMEIFENKRVIVTEKMDGEQFNLSHNYTHARSKDSANHPSRNWVKNFWGEIRYKIPHNVIICGENCYAKHSIHYTNLSTYFFGFNAWIENVCINWDNTVELFEELGITHVPIFYDGIYNEKLIKNISFDETKVEGYVLRLADEFTRDEFSVCVGKYVRENHVQTDEHWMKNPIIPNVLSRVNI